MHTHQRSFVSRPSMPAARMDKPAVTTSADARRCAVAFRRASMAMCASSSREREEGMRRASAVVQEVSSASVWRSHCQLRSGDRVQATAAAAVAAAEKGGKEDAASLAVIDALVSDETGFLEVLSDTLGRHADTVSTATVDETTLAWKEPASWSERHAAAMLLVGVIVHFPRAGHFLLFDAHIFDRLCAILGRAVRAATGADAASLSESERARAAGTAMASLDAIVALSTLVSTGVSTRAERIAGENLPEKLSHPFFELGAADVEADTEDHTSILATLYACVVGALCAIADHAREMADMHSTQIGGSLESDTFVNGAAHDDDDTNSDVRLLKVFTRQVVHIANKSDRNETLAAGFEEHSFGHIRTVRSKHVASEILMVETLE